MKVEQWGSTCLIVRELLAGAAVEECMAAFDRLQDEALAK
jgi:raffinose/stachyose/melibiose transport system substrate-binding protein